MSTWFQWEDICSPKYIDNNAKKFLQAPAYNKQFSFVSTWLFIVTDSDTDSDSEAVTWMWIRVVIWMQREDISIQECIPVGCVPSASAAVGGVCPGGGGVYPSA